MNGIGVVATKGGMGKSSSVVALAGAPYARGLLVLVIDLDPQAAARKLLHQAWALGSKLQRFDPDHQQQHEALPELAA